MSKYAYYQERGGEEAWKPCPVAMLEGLVKDKAPAFTTVLSVSQLADDLASEDRDKLKYLGPLYFDWDGEDLVGVSESAHKLCIALESKGLDMACAKLYATGGRGFHLEVPMGCFIPKLPKDGVQFLPIIYKQMAFDVAVDSLDFRVYSGGRGRMWRTPNVKRENGHYKVPITYAELQEITTESYMALTAAPRELPPPAAPKLAMELMIAYERALESVQERLKKRRKKNVDTEFLRQHKLPSLDAMLAGQGIKPGTGFHQLSLQLAIVAETMGWSEEVLADKAVGLCSTHSSDSSRYNSEGKRRSELIRMHRYIAGNPCYEFSVGGLKAMLSHDAPDLDGIPITSDEVQENIKQAEAAPEAKTEDKKEIKPDEFDDVAGSVHLSKYGVYANTDDGKKRICAVSFGKVHILRSPQTGMVSCYEADVLINGVFMGRQTLELDIFGGLQAFNKFASRHSHAMQGSDSHVRGLMMRVAESGKKDGKTLFVLNREGLDIINIVNHEDPEMREPFMVWSDNKGVVLEPRIAKKGYEFSFQGFPDPRGAFRSDMSDAPELAVWLEEGDNKDTLRSTMRNFIGCQHPSVISKLLGWYTACFYRMLFHKGYSKFPLLHVNGAAGAGKTEMNKLLLSFFYYQQEPKILTPGSTFFAINQHMAGSSSIPLVLDEYKPNDMPFELHGKLKLMFRDTYNCRDVSRGGGTRDNDDYRSLYNTQYSAPLAFIAEAAEEEAAVMERVVLCTVVRPPASLAMKWSTRFHLAERNKRVLSMLGQQIAADVVLTYSPKQLVDEFDVMLAQSQAKYMLNERDLSANLPEEVMKAKQGAKERTVFNYTVAQFGLRKLRALMREIFDNEFEGEFQTLEDSVYDRMTDLLPSTQPEWVKVLNKIAAMSVSVDPMSPIAIRKGFEYQFIMHQGKSALELSARSAYHRYRAYCKSISERPLFPGDHAFLHGLKDCPALLQQGPGIELRVPGGAYVFDLDELARMGVEPFNEV
jgi:hypothetical protein